MWYGENWCTVGKIIPVTSPSKVRAYSVVKEKHAPGNVLLSSLYCGVLETRSRKISSKGDPTNLCECSGPYYNPPSDVRDNTQILRGLQPHAKHKPCTFVASCKPFVHIHTVALTSLVTILARYLAKGASHPNVCHVVSEVSIWLLLSDGVKYLGICPVLFRC